MTKEMVGELELNRIYQRDCIEGMRMIPDKSIDMILCDLPYGTTACKWDTVIPFEPLWEQYTRVIKDGGAIVLTASQPFTSALVMSNPNWFKYSWVWQKSRAANGPIARFQPLKYHEDVLVFGKGRTNYNPQGIVYVGKEASQGGKSSDIMKGAERKTKYIQQYTNYPSTIQQFKNAGKTVHPTQKPVDLFEYLIKTYSNEGEIVLDNCMGSGTTAIATLRAGGGRNFIGFELESEYVKIANQRLENVRNEIAEARLTKGDGANE